jgi:hypothetical protein
MLSCLVDNSYKEASKHLRRDLDFRCPLFGQAVILKAGSKNIAHFLHKPDLGCKHGAGESLQPKAPFDVVFDVDRNFLKKQSCPDYLTGGSLCSAEYPLMLSP